MLRHRLAQAGVQRVQPLRGHLPRLPHFSLQAAQLALHQLVQQRSVLPRHLLPATHDEPPREGRHQVFARRLAHLVLQRSGQHLGFAHDRLRLLRQALIQGVTHGHQLVADLRDLRRESVLDLGHLLLGLLLQALSLALELFLQATQSTLPGVLVDAGDGVLGKVQHAVQVAAREVEQ